MPSTLARRSSRRSSAGSRPRASPTAASPTTTPTGRSIPAEAAVVLRGQRPQALRHLRELAVGQPLEGLAHFRPAVAVAHGQVIVREPAYPSPRAAIGGHDHAVHGEGGLELEPALAPASRLVGALQLLGHDALVTGRERAGHEGVALARR